MSELTEFLLARIAEDEAAAQAVVDSHEMWDWESYVAQAGMYEEPASEFAQRMNPARVLARCAADRRIVDEWQAAILTPAEGESGISRAFDRTELQGRWRALEWVFRVLASVYADHPDYRQEWL